MIVQANFLKGQDVQLDSIIETTILTDEAIDWLIEGDKNFHFIYPRLTYSNRTYYAGREIGDFQDNLRGDIYYFNSNGIFAGFSNAWYSQIEPKLSSTALTIGFSKSLSNKKLRLRASADKYFFHGNSETVFSGSLNFGTTLQKGIFLVRLDYSQLLGSESTSQVSLDGGIRINLLNLGNSGRLQIRPVLSLFFASEEVYEEELIYRNPRFPGVPVYTVSEKFGILNTRFSLPVSLYTGRLDIQLVYNHHFPNSLSNSYSFPNSGQFVLSAGYLIDL